MFVPNAVAAKQITIDAVTAGNFPSTMTVTNLTLSGAGTNVVNWLALSNASATVALHVLTQISMAGGSLLTVTNSSLEVDGSVAIGRSPPASFIASYPALLDVNGGWVTAASAVTLGAAAGSTGMLSIEDGGSLNVTNGVLGIGNNGTTTGGSGAGTATINDATVSVGSLIVGSSAGGHGSLEISNSTVVVSSNITVLSGASYTSFVGISGGSLIATHGPIQVGPLGFCLFTISGGDHVIRQLLLGSTNGFSSGTFIMYGGSLIILGTGAGPGDGVVANSFEIDGGDVDGSGTTITVGDNEHSANASMSGGFAEFAAIYDGYESGYSGTCTVSGGSLVVSSNLVVGQNCAAGINGAIGTFALSGGTLFVTNAAHTAVLDVRNGNFTLDSAGTLVVDNLVMTNPCGNFVTNGGLILPGNCFYTSDLLFNPGAETGDLSGWIPDGNFPGVDDGSFDGYEVLPHTGGYDFIGGQKYSGGYGSLSEFVPLAGNQGITADEIDSGLMMADVSFWEQGADQYRMGPPYDDASVTVAFVDSATNLITSSSTPELASEDGYWTNCRAQFQIPPGTRAIVYTIEFITYGYYDLVYVDDNSLAVYSTQITQPPSLTLVAAGSNVVFSWPAWATDYIPESTTNLADPNSWQPLTNAPAATADGFVLTNALKGPERFYRLRGP